MIGRDTQTAAYWGAAFTIEDPDLDFLYNLLLEDENPLSASEMAQAIVRRRVEREQQARKRREQGAAVYLPKGTYTEGQSLFFPQLDYALGVITAVRPGINPEQGAFDVLTVDLGNGIVRHFAGRLAEHKLNAQSEERAAEEVHAPEVIFEQYGPSITAKLEARLQASADIVRLAGRWFPRALLATINVGHLNLAEAVLDMSGGGPLPTEALLAEIGLPANINPRLQAFSLNYALQEDERFDEVGPAGQVLWYLRRMEPAEVLTPASRLENAAPDHELPALPDVLVALDKELDDEFSSQVMGDGDNSEAVDLYLTYPHRRMGTLPLSSRLARLFPTALITPRVRFLFVDGDTGEKFPGWVVRPGQYVFGLDEWYRRHEFPVGGHLTIRKGQHPGEVIVKADKRRPTREWLRTAAPGSDGRLAFSMQKKQVAIAYDELMVIAVDNFAPLDEVWQRSQAASFDRQVAAVFREIAKLNPQSTVHAKTLYAALNVARRSPPAPIFAELVSRPYFSHVGDAYWRFDLTKWTE